MRVGICCFPSFGGSGVVASELALALAESGDSVHVVSSTRPPRLPEASGVHHHPVDGSGILEYGLFEHPPYTLALANRLAQVAQDCLLDLIHVHYAAPHAVAALPCSATLHAVRLSAGTVVVGPAPASTAARSWRDTGSSTALHWLSEAPPHTGPARRSM